MIVEAGKQRRRRWLAAIPVEGLAVQEFIIVLQRWLEFEMAKGNLRYVRSDWGSVRRRRLS